MRKTLAALFLALCLTGLRADPIGNALVPPVLSGTGSPEGVISGTVGTVFRRTDGGAATTFYVKESGTGSTGWVAYGSPSGTGAPTTATYITQTPNGSLSAEQALNSLATGLMTVTNGTGVITSQLATDLEPQLEAVMDLQDFQGAVTDAQVPDTITLTYLNYEAGFEGVIDLQDLQGAVTDAQVPAAIARDSEVTTLLAGYQPLDADLTAIAALSTTGDFFYRSAAGVWSPVLIGTNLTFVDGTLAAFGGGGGSGTPGGANTQIQFNDLGNFGGDSAFTYNKTTDVLTVPTLNTTALNSTTFAVKDNVDQTHALSFIVNENLTSNINLNLILGATRTLTIPGNATISGVNTGDQTAASLGLVPGVNVQAFDADLSSLAAAAGTNTLYYRNGIGTWGPVTMGVGMSFSGGVLSAAGGAGVPGGSGLQVQFNDGGTFGGAVDFTYNRTTQTLTVPNLVATSLTVPSLSVADMHASALVFEGATIDAHRTQIDATDPTGTRKTWLPDADTKLPITAHHLTLTGPTAQRTVTLPDANFTAARSDAAQTFTGTQTFSPGATVAGLNVGSAATDPSAPTNGSMWYNSTDNLLQARIGGVTVSLESGSRSDVFQIPVGDLTTAITTGVNKAYFRAPRDMTNVTVRASALVAPTGAPIIIDVKENGSTIMTTNKLSIDAGERTSVTAATPAAVTDTEIADDAEVMIDFTQVGSGTAGAGIRVAVYYDWGIEVEEPPPPSDFLMEEDFEGTGWPAGWWAGSTTDPDSTAAPIEGAEDLVADTNAANFTLDTGEPELWGKLKIKVEELPSTFMHIFSMTDVTELNEVFKITLGSTGDLSVQGGGVFETTSAAITADTDYFVWFRYTKGTGANGISRIWFSPVDTKPADASANSAGATNSTAVDDVSKIFFQSIEGDPQPVHFDLIQLSTTSF